MAWFGAALDVVPTSYSIAASGEATLTQCTLSAPGFLTDIGLLLRGATGTQVCRFICYADNGSNVPGNLVASTSEVSLYSTEAVYYVKCAPLISGPVWVAAGTYWLGWWGGATNNYARWGYIASSVRLANKTSLATYHATNAPPSTWGTSDNTSTETLGAIGIYVPRAVPTISAVQDGTHIDVSWS